MLDNIEITHKIHDNTLSLFFSEWKGLCEERKKLILDCEILKLPLSNKFRVLTIPYHSCYILPLQYHYEKEVDCLVIDLHKLDLSGRVIAHEAYLDSVIFDVKDDKIVTIEIIDVSTILEL